MKTTGSTVRYAWWISPWQHWVLGGTVMKHEGVKVAIRSYLLFYGMECRYFCR